jgi:SAM-dependent methyltransferase
MLEVGCGSGVITAELAARASRAAVGLDRRLDVLSAAARRGSGAAFVCGDAAALPFRDDAFDAVVGTFIMVWLADPAAFLREARRVLKSGGLFAALAEPDYEGIIEYPPAASSRDDVVEAVRRWGGDPAAGRKLPALLSAAGFEVFRVGVLNSVWTPSRWAVEEEEEFELLKRLVGASAGGGRWREAARARRAAISKGERCYFLPVFYAAARKGR